MLLEDISYRSVHVCLTNFMCINSYFPLEANVLFINNNVRTAALKLVYGFLQGLGNQCRTLICRPDSFIAGKM